jgi:hypothetical protein
MDAIAVPDSIWKALYKIKRMEHQRYKNMVYNIVLGMPRN